MNGKNGCPRCGGYVFVEQESGTTFRPGMAERVCLVCGWRGYATEPLPLVRARESLRPVRP